MKFLPDPNLTAERIAELRDAVRFAEYELAAGVAVARQLGMTWSTLGEAMGMTKAGASQFAKRRPLSASQLEEGEYDRICRLIGVGDRVPRWEVRVILSGTPGVTKVTRQTLSRHLKREVAEDRCRKREGAELWCSYPDGTSEPFPVRRVTRSHTAHLHHAGDAAF